MSTAESFSNLTPVSVSVWPTMQPLASTLEPAGVPGQRSWTARIDRRARGRRWTLIETVEHAVTVGVHTAVAATGDRIDDGELALRRCGGRFGMVSLCEQRGQWHLQADGEAVVEQHVFSGDRLVVRLAEYTRFGAHGKPVPRQREQSTAAKVDPEMLMLGTAYVLLEHAQASEHEGLEAGPCRCPVTPSEQAEVVNRVEQQTTLIIGLAVDVAITAKTMHGNFRGPVGITEFGQRPAELDQSALPVLGIAAGVAEFVEISAPDIRDVVVLNRHRVSHPAPQPRDRRSRNQLHAHRAVPKRCSLWAATVLDYRAQRQPPDHDGILRWGFKALRPAPWHIRRSTPGRGR
ncbi:hypothetical protein [Fontimonas thermophila]|uniref:hypothetical protein n=1 Tax=Fontimonas thermophila TaxID=1076937 RepID=UPI001F281EB4|nr:hypothetical protein [Fontimonas thermophila]